MSTTADASALSVSGLNKNYGNFQVLRNLDLDIASGSVHGLVGLNGSGKTTTLECVLGLLAYNSGSISLLGYRPEHLYRSRGRVVGIFDSPSLNPNLSVRQCLTQAAMLVDTPVRTPVEAEALLGIERFHAFKIRELSLGNKRRASIAHALLGNPELIILDEPFNGLDAEGVDDVLALITRLNKESGSTFLLSSHQLPYLEQVCSHIAILHRGEIVTSAAVEQLLSGTESMALIKTADTVRACDLLGQHTDSQCLPIDEEGYLPVTLSGMTSAELNQFLVNHDIAVEELVLQRATLDKLFRDITQEPGS